MAAVSINAAASAAARVSKLQDTQTMREVPPNRPPNLPTGTIPIVNHTGGLADTVRDVADGGVPEHERNGFVFSGEALGDSARPWCLQPTPHARAQGRARAGTQSSARPPPNRRPRRAARGGRRAPRHGFLLQRRGLVAARARAAHNAAGLLLVALGPGLPQPVQELPLTRWAPPTVQ